MNVRGSNRWALSSLRWWVMLGALVLSLLALFFTQGWGSLSSWGLGAFAYLCPLGGLEVWLAGGGITGRAVLGVGIALLMIVLLGRFFCGWLCPTPLLKKAFTRTNRARVIPIHPVARQTVEVEREKSLSFSRFPYYSLLGVLGASMALGFPFFCLICPVGITFALVVGLGQLLLGYEVQSALWLFVLVLVVEILFLKRWCHVWCPLGALMRLLAHVNRLFLPKVEPQRCLHAQGVDCHVCREACPEGLDLTRPLTAQERSNCTHCHVCAEACPVEAIYFFQKPSRKTSSVEQTSSPGKPYHLAQLAQEAQRCVLCGACEEACPQHQPITLWMKHLKAHEYRQVAKLLLKPGQWPECSALCPSERLCEQACAGTQTKPALPIRAIEEGLGAFGKKRGDVGCLVRTRSERVAIVGAGVAGLACAEVLNRHGIQVDVYERQAELGGLLRSGIPHWKVPARLLTERREALQAAGVHFHFGVEVGAQLPYRALLETHDALFLAQGAQRVRELSPEIEGYAKGKGIQSGLAYLRAVHSVWAQEVGVEPSASLAGRDVLILGGGETMADCAAGALREGVHSVTVLYRRERSRMKCAEETLKTLLEGGVRLITEDQLVRLERTEVGDLAAVVLQGAGRLNIDRILVAYGATVETSDALTSLGLEIDPVHGITTLTGSLRTTLPNVYVGGDMHAGASLLARALGEGRQAGYEILADFGIKEGKPWRNACNSTVRAA